MMADIFTQIKLKASNGPAFSLVLSKNVNSWKTYISFHKISLILPFFSSTLLLSHYNFLKKLAILTHFKKICQFRPASFNNNKAFKKLKDRVELTKLKIVSIEYFAVTCIPQEPTVNAARYDALW